MPQKRDVIAIIWDFDGTLADTSRRNLSVTKAIVETVTGKSAREFDTLKSLANYDSAVSRAVNWRDLYIHDLGLTERETDDAGKLWTEYQLKDHTSTPVYEGIAEVLVALSHVPHGIVSQNSRANIIEILEGSDIARYFRVIVGYEEVDYGKEKPEPDGILSCVDKLTPLKQGNVFYVGDHESDFQCAANANRVLRSNELDVRVVSVAALYGSSKNDSAWPIRPDFSAKTPQEITNIVHNF